MLEIVAERVGVQSWDGQATTGSRPCLDRQGRRANTPDVELARAEVTRGRTA